MKEELRCLGISMGMAGTGIMDMMIDGKITTSDLTDKQVQDVLDAWETRNYVPCKLIKKVDRVEPAITKKEIEAGTYSQEEYNRNYVEMIEKYLHTMM